MKLPPSLVAVLHSPAAETVWALRGDLLSLGVEPAGKAFELLAEFHRYLDRIETGDPVLALRAAAGRFAGGGRRELR